MSHRLSDKCGCGFWPGTEKSPVTFRLQAKQLIGSSLLISILHCLPAQRTHTHARTHADTCRNTHTHGMQGQTLEKMSDRAEFLIQYRVCVRVCFSTRVHWAFYYFKHVFCQYVVVLQVRLSFFFHQTKYCFTFFILFFSKLRPNLANHSQLQPNVQ